MRHTAHRKSSPLHGGFALVARRHLHISCPGVFWSIQETMASTKGRVSSRRRGASEVLDSGVLAGLQVLDRTKMAEVVEIFIADTIGHLRSLDRGIHRADAVFVARKCHGLQGSSAKLGAATMANLCGQLKVAADDSWKSNFVESDPP
jgi:HPt (histidine-containing phosphotransfer) domain-containing protein